MKNEAIGLVVFVVVTLFIGGISFVPILRAVWPAPSCAALQHEMAGYREFMQEHSCGSMQVEDFMGYYHLKDEIEKRCED